jgi:quinol monooxygenase YgiN
MYITICDFRVEGDGDAFDAWFLEHAEVMRGEPGNRRYELARDARRREGRTVTEVWDTKDDHLAHLNHPVHVDLIAFGSDRGMRDIYVHHWEDARGYIEQGRERSESRRADPEERPEMYAAIEKLRAERSLAEADRPTA